MTSNIIGVTIDEQSLSLVLVQANAVVATQTFSYLNTKREQIKEQLVSFLKPYQPGYQTVYFTLPARDVYCEIFPYALDPTSGLSTSEQLQHAASQAIPIPQTDLAVQITSLSAQKENYIAKGVNQTRLTFWNTLLRESCQTSRCFHIDKATLMTSVLPSSLPETYHVLYKTSAGVVWIDSYIDHTLVHTRAIYKKGKSHTKKQLTTALQQIEKITGTPFDTCYLPKNLIPELIEKNSSMHVVSLTLPKAPKATIPYEAWLLATKGASIKQATSRIDHHAPTPAYQLYQWVLWLFIFIIALLLTVLVGTTLFSLKKSVRENSTMVSQPVVEDGFIR